MDETLKVKIVVDNSQAKSAISSVKQGFANTTQSTEHLNEGIEAVKNSLIDVKRVNRTILITSTFKEASQAIKGCVKELKEYAKWTKTVAKGESRLRFMSVLDTTHDVEFRGLLPTDKLKALKLTLSNIKKIINDTTGGLLSSLPVILNILGSIALVVGTIKSLVSQIKNSINVAANGDDIKDSAQKVYLSTTAYQEWGYVLKQNGIEISSLKMAMRTFSKQVAGSADVLKKYGVTADNVSDAFEQAIYNVQNLETETEKITAVTELFGTRASELMPILNMTNGETKDLLEIYRAIGGTMSNELIAKSDVLTDSIVAMKSAWQGLKNTLASGLMPILTKVVQWLTLAVAKVNILIKAILGISETFGGAEKHSGGIADGLNEATTAASKLKKQLMGFDELNRLDGNDGSAASGLGIDAEDYESFGNMFEFDDEMLDKLNDFKAKVEEIKEVLRIATPVLLTGAGLLLAVLGFAHGNIFMGIAGLVLAGIGITIGATNGAWADIFGGVVSAIKNNAGLVLSGVGILLMLWGGITCNLPLLLVGAGLAAMGINVTQNGDGWQSMFGNLHNIINTFIPHLLTGIGVALALYGVVTANIPLFAVGAGMALLGVSVNATGGWKELGEKIVSFIDRYTPAILTGIGLGLTLIAALTCNIPLFAAGCAMAGLGTYAMNAGGWSGVTTQLKKDIESVKNWWDTKIAKFFTANYWTQKWNTIKTNCTNGIRNTLNSIIQRIESAVNNIVNKFNNTGLIRGINKILGTSISLPTISIPRLAKGGVITTPTVAMMGEYAGARNNPEIATPQSLLESTMDESNGKLVAAFAQMAQQIIGAINDKEMEVTIGDDVIAKSAARGNNAYIRRTGRPLIATV